MSLRVIVVLAAAAALAACGARAGDDNQVNEFSNVLANGSADAGVTRSRSFAGLMGAHGGKDAVAAASDAPGAPIEPSLIVGRWSEEGRCDKTWFEFLEDGTLHTSQEGSGTWSLDGDRLTLTGGEGSAELHVTSIDAGGMTVVNSDGATGRTVRC